MHSHSFLTLSARWIHPNRPEAVQKTFPEIAQLYLLFSGIYSLTFVCQLTKSFIVLNSDRGKRRVKVAIYARVSTKDKGQDVKNQLEQLRAYCQSARDGIS